MYVILNYGKTNSLQVFELLFFSWTCFSLRANLKIPHVIREFWNQKKFSNLQNDDRFEINLGWYATKYAQRTPGEYANIRCDM